MFNTDSQETFIEDGTHSHIVRPPKLNFVADRSQKENEAHQEVLKQKQMKNVLRTQSQDNNSHSDKSFNDSGMFRQDSKFKDISSPNEVGRVHN